MADGDGAMTASQASLLQTLCQEAGAELDDSLSETDAAQRINHLQAQIGRGGETPAPADREQ